MDPLFNPSTRDAFAGTVEAVADLEVLVTRAAGGDEQAWQELWQQIEPLLAQIVSRPRFLGRMAHRVDDRRNIVVEVMSRLRASSCRRLASYVAMREERPELRFETWLRVVAKRVAIDYLRAHPDYVDRRRSADASTPGAWVEPGTLPPASQLPGERPPVTNRGTAQQLLRYAAGTLVPQHARALEMWVQSESYEAIAASTGIATAAEAERIVRAAIERLRRKFREGDGHD